MNKPTVKAPTLAQNLLGSYSPQLASFPGIENITATFKKKPFLDLTIRKRFRTINQTLCKLIQEAPPHSFLLSAVIDFIGRVNREKVLNDPFNIASFEFWLNNFSELSDQENYQIRAKIVGKMVPRGDYQSFFPIGMGRSFMGTHFIAAHLSPDVDTTIASFWGWIDAFAARVGTGLHLWSLPGGPPDSPVTAIMGELFGKDIFTLSARVAPTLTLTAMDLVSQQKFCKELGSKVIGQLDHGANEKAIILVNDQGHYLGDWRSSDIEVVRQIIISFKSCLRWFENNLHSNLISLFAKIDLSTKDFPQFFSSVFDVKIGDCEPALEFNEKQKQDLDAFFCKILKVSKGLNGSFRDLIASLESLSVPEMAHLQVEVEALPKSDLFDSSGLLLEDRPKIFHRLEKLIQNLDKAILQVRDHVERLDVVLGIKHQVLHIPHLYINLKSDVEEIKEKILHYSYLTVVIHEQAGALFPVGVVNAVDLRKQALGTVSLRDFCNLDEVKMASYLEVISVVDHHKSSLKTVSVPAALIGDAQSCNVLIAEQEFIINDRYSLGGMTAERIEREIQSHQTKPLADQKDLRLSQRLLKRRMAAHFSKDGFYINPDREFTEYLCFLHAILDDTDLLTKVSDRDVECVGQLLNRMKSISVGVEVEIVNFDDIPRDKNFAKVAAKRLLQNEDLHSLYKKIYDYRETDVEANLHQCAKGEPSTTFADTKEQNGCARVGQTKLFDSNFPYFQKNAKAIEQHWLRLAQESHQDHPEIDLHLHMISTIASATEVYKSQIGPYSHQDELWIWAPLTSSATDHLASFLASFQHVAKSLNDTSMSVEFFGPMAEEYQKIFEENFIQIPMKISDKQVSDIPPIILRFRASALNSRKSMVTPYIPRLVP